MKAAQSLFFVSFLLMGIGSYSQRDGQATIDGKITDPRYKDLAGVKILLKDAVTSITVDSAESVGNGEFKFSGVRTGLYRLQLGQEAHADTGFAFSIGQVFPSHNKKLLLFFTYSTEAGLYTQKRQFSGSYNEWYGMVPPGKLVNLIAEYERLDPEVSGNLCGTTLDQRFQALKKVTVKLYRAGEAEPVAKTVSDAQGNYTFVNVQSGLYKLVFATGGREVEGAPFEVQPGWKLTLKDAVRPVMGKTKG